MGGVVLATSIVVTLRPGDPGGPRHAVRAARAAASATPVESVAGTVARAMLQAGLTGAIAALASGLLTDPAPDLAAAPAAVVLALGVGDLRALVAVVAAERERGRSILARRSSLAGWIPLPGLRRLGPAGLSSAPTAPPGPPAATRTRRPPVWLIGPGAGKAEGAGETRSRGRPPSLAPTGPPPAATAIERGGFDCAPRSHRHRKDARAQA